MPRVKYLDKDKAKKVGLSKFPSFHASGSIRGMKDKYYGKDALLVKSGEHIYNVTTAPRIYRMAK